MTLKELIRTEVYGDWTNAIAAAGVETLSPDAEVVWSEEGQNDGPEWRAIFRTSPSSVVALRAWCDYTGWDCQAGGDSKEFANPDEARAWLESPQ